MAPSAAPNPAVVTYQMARKLGTPDPPPLRRKAIQAKHISDEEVLALHRARQEEVARRKKESGSGEWIWGHLPPAVTTILCERYPEKVVLAKQLSMERRGLLAPLTSRTWMLPDGVDTSKAGIPRE